MMDQEESSSESGSMMGGNPTDDNNMWVVTGSASLSQPESAERALAFSPPAAPNWQTQAPYVVEPTPLTTGSNIVPSSVHKPQHAGPHHVPNTSVHTAMPTGLNIITSPPAAYPAGLTNTYSTPVVPRYTPVQQPAVTHSHPYTAAPQTVIRHSEPISSSPYLAAQPTVVQSTAVPKQVMRQVPSQSPHQQPITLSNAQPYKPQINYKPIGVDLNPSAISAIAPMIQKTTPRAHGPMTPAPATTLPVTTPYPYKAVPHAPPPAVSPRKFSKYPYDSPLVDLHGRPAAIMPRLADPATPVKNQQKWQTARAPSIMSYATTDRRFSLDTTPWSTKAEWMPAFRSGVKQYPDHIVHKHPAFPQGGIPSPLALYYFDETAPNAVLLRNDVPLAGVQKLANELKRCDGCGPQQKVAARALKPHLSSSIDGSSLLGGLDEEMTMSSNSTTASRTGDEMAASLRDASLSELTSAHYDSTFVQPMPSKQKPSAVCCGPASVSSRQFTLSGKATTDYDLATTASRTGTSGVRGFSKPLSTARSGRSTARSGRSGRSSSRSGYPYTDGRSTSKGPKSKRSISRSPSQSRVSSFARPQSKRVVPTKSKKNAVCCGQDDDEYSVMSRDISAFDSFSSSDSLTSASSLHQHHMVPDAMSTPYIQVHPPSTSKSFARSSKDAQYLTPDRVSAYRPSQRSATGYTSSVATGTTGRGRSSQRSASRKKSGRSTISAVPGYVRKKQTDCCGNQKTVMEPSSYVADSMSRSASVFSTVSKSIPDYSSRSRSKSKSKYSDRSASRGPRSEVSRFTSRTGASSKIPRTTTDLSRWRSAAKPKAQPICCGGGDQQSYPASVVSGRFGSQSLGTGTYSYKSKDAGSESGSSYMFSDSQSSASHDTPRSHRQPQSDRPPQRKSSGRSSHTASRRSGSGISSMSMSRSHTALSGTSALEDFSFSRSTTFRTDYSRHGKSGKGTMCGPKKDLQYDVYKFFFDARDVKPAKRGTPYKMLPQFTTSYKSYPNVAYEVVAPRNRHDFMESRQLPSFAY